MQIWKQFSSNGLGPRCKEISPRDRERLFFLMHQMLRCGQPTEASLRAVGKAFKQEKKDSVSIALNAIAQKVAQGRTLSRAMETEYVMFDDIHRAAIMAGEISNNMTESFSTLQMLEDKKILAARDGIAEIVTPTALFVLSSASLFNTGLNTLPVMADVKRSQGQELGAVPLTIMEITQTCADYWYVIATAFAFLMILAFSLLKSTNGRFLLDSYVLRVPALGKFIAYKTYANMLLYFPHLIASGVKPKQMIPIMEALAGNSVLRRRIDKFNQVITTGGQMSEAMAKAGFPTIAVTPVQVSENYAGNESGVNDVMIEGMNHSYNIIERELTDAHKRFIGVFSTIMWLLGGGVMLLEMMSIVLSQN